MKILIDFWCMQDQGRPWGKPGKLTPGLGQPHSMGQPKKKKKPAFKATILKLDLEIIQRYQL